MPDTASSVEALLSQVEQQLDVVDHSLLNDDADALDSASANLRQVSIVFARALEAALSAETFEPAFRRRIETVARRLTLQRESLARRSVVVQRALSSLMGPSVSATYSMPGRAPTFGVH